MKGAVPGELPSQWSTKEVCWQNTMIMVSCFDLRGLICHVLHQVCELCILPALSALRCAWNVTGYNIHVDCRENFVLHHCILQGLQSQSIDNNVSCSQTLAGRRGSLRDSGYV